MREKKPRRAVRGHSRPAIGRLNTTCAAKYEGDTPSYAAGNEKTSSGEETMEKKKVKTTRTKWKKGQIVLLVVLGAFALLLLVGGIFLWNLLERPETLFDSNVQQTVTAVPEVTPLFDIKSYLSEEEQGTSTDPNDSVLHAETVPEAKTITGMVNVALFGIDAREDGSSTSGSMPHTDANMIVAINFDTKEVSLISIARDCFTSAPGHRGFYKFNGIFNVGGGMDDPKAGFELSCRAAEEWLGGVAVPYYYGVDFQALIDLVDMIGGIDFDVDITLHTLDGKTVKKGHRHLDGQGVMAYMRMRKTAEGLDSYRTARQRKMLVAIFRKLKEEGKLSMIPDLLKNMSDNVYTNTTLTQTVALANFAQEIDPDSIQSYSFQGHMKEQYLWRYCFIDQQSRIDIIKKVYGIEAEPMYINSPVYETFLYDSGFLAIQYINTAKKILEAVHAADGADNMTEAQKKAYARCWKDLSNLQAKFQEADQWTRAHYDDSVDLTSKEAGQRRNLYSALTELETKLKKSGNALNKEFGSPYKPDWDRSISKWSGKGSVINEVYVDFR